MTARIQFDVRKMVCRLDSGHVDALLAVLDCMISFWIKMCHICSEKYLFSWKKMYGDRPPTS